MKNIFKGLFIGAAVLVMSSCVKDELAQIDITKTEAPVLHELTDYTAVLEENGSFGTLEWDAADYGAAAAVRYTLYVTYGDSQQKVTTTDAATSLALDANTLNTPLMRLGCPWDEEITVSFYLTSDVKSSSGTIKGYTLTSNTIDVNLTAFYQDVSHDCLYVRGGLNSWADPATGPYFYNFADDQVVYQGVIDFTENYMTITDGFKFTGVAEDWDHGNYGAGSDEVATNPDDYTFINDGGSGNIHAYEATYRYFHFTVDLDAMNIHRDYGFDECVLNLNGTDYPMEYTLNQQRFYVDVDNASGTATIYLDGETPNDHEGFTADLDVSGAARVYLDFNDLDEIVISASASAYGTDENEGVTGPTQVNNTWVLAGDFSEWAYISMTNMGNGVYVAYDVEVTEGDGCGFHDLYDTWYAADAAIANTDAGLYQPTIDAGFAIKAWNDGDGSVNIIVPSTGTYDFWVDTENSEAWLMTEGTEPDGIEYGQTWKLSGEMNGWGSLRMTDLGSNFYLASAIESTADQQYGFKDLDDFWWSAPKDETHTDSYTATVGEAVPIVKDGVTDHVNIVIPSDNTYDFYVYAQQNLHYLVATGDTPGKVASSWGISGTTNNWGKALTGGYIIGDFAITEEVTVDGTTYLVYYGLVLTDDDQIQFRYDNAWDSQYGSSQSFIKNTAMSLNSKSNISCVAGTYDVYFDLTGTTAYFMEEGKTPSDAVEREEEPDWWGIEGSFTDNWTSIITMTQNDAGYWVATDVTMAVGDTFKFIEDGSWDVGDLGSTDSASKNAVLTLATGGSNISVTEAGTYDVYLDVDNLKAYIMETGKTPSDIQ